MLPPPRLLYSVAFYVLAMVLLIVARPASMFQPDGQPRAFGSAADATMFPLGVATVALAVGSLYAFAMIDLMCGGS